jgi:5-methylcytosine-specific restriction endonuclease McrA
MSAKRPMPAHDDKALRQSIADGVASWKRTIKERDELLKERDDLQKELAKVKQRVEEVVKETEERKPKETHPHTPPRKFGSRGGSCVQTHMEDEFFRLYKGEKWFQESSTSWKQMEYELSAAEEDHPRWSLERCVLEVGRKWEKRYLASRPQDPAKRKKRKTIPKSVRAVVWRRDSKNNNANCFACDVALTSFTVHYGHVKPVRDGGEATADNLRLLCADCNLSMGSEEMYDFIRRHFPNNKRLKTGSAAQA